MYIYTATTNDAESGRKACCPRGTRLRVGLEKPRLRRWSDLRVSLRYALGPTA